MRIIAIDQSYTLSGIVVMDDISVIHAEKYTTDKAKDKFARAWELTNHIKTLVEEYNPDIIAMEGLAFGMRGDATRDLAGLQFVVVSRLRFEDNYDVEIYAPTTIKKVATGKGNAKKDMLIECLPNNIREIFDELGVKKTTGLRDLTDAYWIGRTALQQRA